MLWKHLLTFEKTEISKQMPKLLNDSNIDRYRFVKTKDGSWSIPNAMTLPIGVKTKWVYNG